MPDKIPYRDRERLKGRAIETMRKLAEADYSPTFYNSSLNSSTVNPESFTRLRKSPRFTGSLRGTLKEARPWHFMNTWDPFCLTRTYPRRSKALTASLPETLGSWDKLDGELYSAGARGSRGIRKIFALLSQRLQVESERLTDVLVSFFLGLALARHSGYGGYSRHVPAIFGVRKHYRDKLFHIPECSSSFACRTGQHIFYARLG